MKRTPYVNVMCERATAGGNAYVSSSSYIVTVPFDNDILLIRAVNGMFRSLIKTVYPSIENAETTTTTTTTPSNHMLRFM